MIKPKTVFISGATGDFGQAFARRFAKIGSSLVLHGRNQQKLDEMKKKLLEIYDIDIALCNIDLSDTSSIVSGLQNVPAEFQTIDLLINNAGCALGQSDADQSDLQDWLNMIAINNSALAAITHFFLPKMVENGKGHVINIGSIAGTYSYPGGHVYCAVKAFTKQFSLALRSDLYNKNIRVTNIEPGMVETQFSEVRFKGNIDKANSVYANTDPLTADDIAESVFWAACAPNHVNINSIEIMPTRQAPGGLIVDRN